MKHFAAALLLLAPLVLLAQNESEQQFAQIDSSINEAIQTGLIPGAVLVVGRGGNVLYRKAYGSRSLTPRREPMTLDTIFDAASLTKVVATTPSVMPLFEQGKLRIHD